MNDGSERATIPHLHLSFSKAAYVRLPLRPDQDVKKTLLIRC